MFDKEKMIEKYYTKSSNSKWNLKSSGIRIYEIRQ